MIDFGVFVDIGVHQDGLVHISEVANRRLRHPSEAVKVGDVVKVVVLSVDEKRHRISLSMKQAGKTSRLSQNSARFPRFLTLFLTCYII